MQRQLTCMLAAAVVACYLATATAQAGANSGKPRSNTCPLVSECLKAKMEARDMDRSSNYNDYETEIMDALEAIAAKGENFNGVAACNPRVIRDFINKWKRVEVLRKDRLERMDQCVNRLNNWGRGFDPCQMPAEKDMPTTCSTPMDVLRQLIGGPRNVDIVPGRSGLWALLADPDKVPVTRSKRSILAVESELDSPFASVHDCFKDNCGCPEIQMCKSCYKDHRSAKELVTLEQGLLAIQWKCGIIMKNSKTY